MIDGQPQPHQVYVPHLNLRICYLVRLSPQEGLSLRVWYAKSLLWLTDRYFTFSRSVSVRGASNKKLMTITIHRVVIIIIARITAWSAAGIAAGVIRIPRGKTAGNSVDAADYLTFPKAIKKAAGRDQWEQDSFVPVPLSGASFGRTSLYVVGTCQDQQRGPWMSVNRTNK